MGRSPNIQSVERAFAVLRALSSDRGVVTSATITARTGLPKSTISRLLSTMTNIGVVEKVAEAGYMVGRELRAIAHPGVGPFELIGVAGTYLRELVDDLGEDAGLAVPDGDHALYIDQVQKMRPVQVQDWTGDRFAHHTNAAGRVFMASWNEEDLEAYLTRPPAAGSVDKRVENPDRLRHQVEETRRAGYAWTFEVWAEGVNGVAAPIEDDQGQVVAAINVFGPAYRFPGDRDQALIGRSVVESAGHISRHLRVGQIPSSTGAERDV